MAPLLEKHKGGNAHDYGPDTTAEVNAGQNHIDISPRAALEKVLFFNSQLPDYSSTRLSPKLGEIIRLQKLAKTSKELQEIINRPDCDSETAESAASLKHSIDSRLGHITSGHELKKHLQTPDARMIASDPHVDAHNYLNTAPIAGLIIDEQISKRDISDPKELLIAIDTGIIAETLEQRANYARAHEIESIQDKARAFTDLLESLNDTMSKINTKGNLPMTKSINHLLSAKTLHDLALIGELGSKENRDMALRAAVNDLWDAKSQIESAPKSAMTAGILNDIMNFIDMYSKEIDINPKTRPDSRMFDITPEKRADIVTYLGEVAATNSSTQPHAA